MKNSVKWPNGEAVSKDDLIEVVMYNYGESYETAVEDLKSIDQSKLQRFVDFYAEKH